MEGLKSRASKEFNRGYSPKRILLGALGVTLLFSAADEGSVTEGIKSWMGDWGGNTANGTEVAGGGIATGADVVWDGGNNAVDRFQEEFDGEIPSVEANLGSVGTATGIQVESGDSYWSLLSEAGMSSSEIAACDSRVDLNSLPVLSPGQEFNNPC